MEMTAIEILREVRKVLVRNWIDLGRVFVRVADGQVHLTGKLSLIARAPHELNDRTIGDMLAAITRIPSVPDVRAEFDNWDLDDGGTWRPV
jgi:hypothetical protein